MDEDLLALCFMVGLLVIFPFSVVIFTLGCISYARTAAWDRERNKRATSLESSSSLLNPNKDDDDDSEFYDTDDEAEASERKAEEVRDLGLTFGQKWRKEFGKCWKGKGVRQVQKEREREERRKLAKAVARELERRERRRVREAERRAELPPYKN